MIDFTVVFLVTVHVDVHILRAWTQASVVSNIQSSRVPPQCLLCSQMLFRQLLKSIEESSWFLRGTWVQPLHKWVADAHLRKRLSAVHPENHKACDRQPHPHSFDALTTRSTLECTSFFIGADSASCPCSRGHLSSSTTSLELRSTFPVLFLLRLVFFVTKLFRSHRDNVLHVASFLIISFDLHVFAQLPRFLLLFATSSSAASFQRFVVFCLRV